MVASLVSAHVALGRNLDFLSDCMSYEDKGDGVKGCAAAKFGKQGRNFLPVQAAAARSAARLFDFVSHTLPSTAHPSFAINNLAQNVVEKNQ